MSPLITLENICLAFGLDALLDHVKLQIEAKERVCLIGRNGAGKSSLLKIIAGDLLPDSGMVWRKPGLRLARLTQELSQDNTGTLYEFVSSGLDKHSLESWKMDHQINKILNRLNLSANMHFSQLSGGWQRRAALARALVAEPDLLLLDEPTNHLDIAAIKWLEKELLGTQVTLLFITHDRTFLQNLATRIIELDRGKLKSYPLDYQQFLRQKDELLQTELKHHKDFDKKLAEEERWIRQGIKARRTRNEGRVRTLEKMREIRAKRRTITPDASFNINQANQSGQLVIEAQHINHLLNNKALIKDFSIRIMRGDRIGLVGPNGVGKTTLLNILLGTLPPANGTVTLGTKLKIAYFDQLRAKLDLEKSVIDNVVEGSEMITVNDKKKHIISYLSDFLFTPARSLTPAKALSGGERNRLVLAKIFSLPTNLLVLDEPTNDLDIETLELLEELLSQYSGTLLVVSHDRSFLENVVTSILLFTEDGKITEYMGGYQTLADKENVNEIKKVTHQSVTTNSTKPSKLSYKDKKELEILPQKIEDLEQQKLTLEAILHTEDFYKQSPEKIKQTLEDLQNIESEIEKAYNKWQELELHPTKRGGQ